MKRIVVEPHDVTYVRASYAIAETVDPELPAPSYYDEDGRAYVPHDYADQERSRERFDLRARAEAKRLQFPIDEQWIEEAWASYRDGIFGVCLKTAQPETIVEKEWHVTRIESMLEHPDPHNEEWHTTLRRHVDALDDLERPFTAFDREYFGGSVSRDRCITAVRAKYFSEENAARSALQRGY